MTIAADFRQAMAHLDAIQAAVRPVATMTWTHGEDCPHRYCDEPDECEDGHHHHHTTTCEAPGEVCDCGVAKLKNLLAVIKGAA